MSIFNLRQSYKESKVKFLWRIFFLGFATLFLYFFLIRIGLFGKLPDIEEIENPQNKLATEIYSADSVLLGKYYFDNRTPVEYKDLSPALVKTLVASEDKRFYEHSGIDILAIVRAVFYMGKRGGGSTLTQQTAKNLFSAGAAQNIIARLIQKSKEYVISVVMERKFTKEEIITLYLNTYDFLYNAKGISSASHTYFNKEPKDLDYNESAVLVGMLQNPSYYNPKRFPENALEKRNIIFGLLLEQNQISQEEYNVLMKKEIVLDWAPFSHVDGMAPYFRMVLSEQLKKWGKQTKKLDGTNYDIYRDGLKIYTTLDSRMQKHAEEAVKEHLTTYQKVFDNQFKSNWKPWESKQGKTSLNRAIKDSDPYLRMKEAGKSEKSILAAMDLPHRMEVFTWKGVKDTTLSSIDSIKHHRQFLQTGFMVMEKETGHVKAWVGGIDFEFFKYDHANTNTKRQVGSTFKPILYALAVDNGWSPCMNIPGGTSIYLGMGKYWKPKGGGGGSLQGCLKVSSNACAAYIIKNLGTEATYQMAKKMGVTTNIPKVPSIALGACEISLQEMMEVYSVFLNEGVRNSPVLVTKIEDKNGNIIQTFFTDRKEVFSNNSAYIMTKMLMGPTTTGGTAARLKNSYKVPGEVAGKTGTTNGQADGWFIGFTPQYLAGAWVGCDDPVLRFLYTGNGQGAAMALPIWAKFFNKCYADKRLDFDPQIKFNPPSDSSLVKNICRDPLKERMQELHNQGGNVITDHGTSTSQSGINPDDQFE